MGEISSRIIEKITSYNLFNNFFPGIIVCYIIEKTTRLSIVDGDLVQNLFVYYFVGIIVSRISSLFIEKVLRSIKVKNKKSRQREPFLKFAPYDKYIEASEKQSFIKVLDETNNVYRTIIAIFVVSLVIKLYDWLLYDFVIKFGSVSQNVLYIVVCVFMIILFVCSYRKQTAYIRKRVEELSIEDSKEE